MRRGQFLALLVVLVLSMAVAAPPALSAVCVLEHGSPCDSGEVDILGMKGEGSNDNSGDDDRWGDPAGSGEENEVNTGGDAGADTEDDERPWWGNPLGGDFALRLIFGSWFVL